MKSWLRLLRVSLAPSAAADAVAGLVYGCAGFPADARAWWLVAASLCVYHGALALNDWNDREHDARTRPARPIPSGAVRPEAALAAGIALILSGVGCAWLAAPSSALWMGLVALLAVVYDVAGRGAWRGPLLLGLCRAGNLGSGVHWAAGAGVLALGPAAAFLPAVLYGLYVFRVSQLGRLEDGEDPRPLLRRPSRLLGSAGLALVALAVTPAPSAIPARVAALGVACAGALALFQVALGTPAWTRADVERAMGLALRRLLIAAAVVALLAVRPGAWDGAYAAAAILAGYPLAHALRRAFPPS